MVKPLLLICVLAFLAACGQSEEKFTLHKEFNSEKFEIKGYTDRVLSFLRSRPETNDLDNYQAIFVNTEDCSSCIRGSFSELYHYLEKTEKVTFVYANDSTLGLAMPSDNKKVAIVYLPAEKFKEKEIFHKELYLYEYDKGDFKSVFLDSERKDSLN